MSSPDPRTNGAHHLGLTVPDLPLAVSFFCSALGFRLVKEKPDYPAAFVSDGVLMLTLWQAQQPPVAFDRKKNIGLHHLALTLRPGQSLDELAALLAEREDVDIEFFPESLGPGPARHLMCTVAGGLRLELVCAAG